MVLLYTQQCYQSWYCWFQRVWSDTLDHHTVVFWIHITPLWNWCFSQCMRYCDVIHIFSVSKWSLQILLRSINTSVCSFRIIFYSRPCSRFIVRIDKLMIVPFKMCFSLNRWSKIFISKFFNNVGRVYNKFIIITVTWSEMLDHVSLTGANH